MSMSSSILHQGADFTKSTKQTLSLRDTFAKTKSCSSSLTSLMRALPNQGTLLPYEKVPIFFRFSPRYNNSRQGWKGTSTPPPRQDFALYMNIVTVGNSGGSDVTNEKQIGIGGIMHLYTTLTAVIATEFYIGKICIYITMFLYPANLIVGTLLDLLLFICL